MKKYSIIVCSYNRFPLLDETIISIINTIGDREDCEILIIDNNSKDKTPSLKALHDTDNRIKYFLEKKQGLSHARNRGMAESSGEILIYLDDDIDLPSNYFEVLDEIFSDKKIDISGGKVVPYKCDIPKWLPNKYYFLVSVYDMGEIPKEIKYIMGGNFAIRKLIANQIGFYNTNLGRNGNSLGAGEEIDYQNRANLMGYKIFYEPRQLIYHKINEKLNENYVLSYARELGKSERIVDRTFSKTKFRIKIIKSYCAIFGYHALNFLIKEPRKKTYLKIINQYGIGYLEKTNKILKDRQ